LHLALEKYADRIDLFEEVIMLSIISYNLSELYPNMIMALKVMVTIPITVVSAQQSVSKLELLHKLPVICD
jgi:hypothetical protein